jgi:hypothetical protein
MTAAKLLPQYVKNVIPPFLYQPEVYDILAEDPLLSEDDRFTTGWCDRAPDLVTTDSVFF